MVAGKFMGWMNIHGMDEKFMGWLHVVAGKFIGWMNYRPIGYMFMGWMKSSWDDCMW